MGDIIMEKPLVAKGRQAASVAVILALLSAPAANAEDCTTNADAMREKISAFQKQAQDAYGTIQSEFGKSTSSSYSKDYFAKFEDRNKGAKEATDRSEEHTSELQSLQRISYAVLCLTNKNKQHTH